VTCQHHKRAHGVVGLGRDSHRGRGYQR
jgi:hypothetical protein